jgi:hypothetical protein
MQKKYLWNLFSKTGNINIYLLYKEWETCKRYQNKSDNNYDKELKNVALR